MALENLYQCTQEELQDLPQQLAEAFFNDDLYVTAFPKEATRMECMVYYFQHYLTAIGPNSMFLADCEDKNTIMVVYDSRRYQKKAYMKRLLRLNIKLIKLLPMMGFHPFLNLVKGWDMFSSRWLKDFERDDHFHLDLIFTKHEMQHKGIGERMVRELIDEGDIMDMDVSVETHHRENALWYEKLGFVLMNTIVDEENGLHQYCLIARHMEEQTSWIRNIE